MSGRRLSDDERALWKGVVRAITPLRRPRSPSEPDDVAPVAAPAKPVRQQPQQHSPQQIRPPTLAPFDRRLRQRVARGRESIDARLDLHGMTQSEAHAVLLSFLHRAQADGVRLALVVTGKGAGKTTRETPSESGVLRRKVPMWLSLPEFRRLVVSFEEAHSNHGGQGALYVRMRRRVR
jgi:DNA-nicking Smr family endonuclease